MNDSIKYSFTGKYSLLITIAIYITIFINSLTFFSQPFEFYVGYIVYIFLLPGFIRRFGLNRNLFFIFFILLITGLYNLLLGNNTVPQFAKIFLGLFFAYLFYDYVIKAYDVHVDTLFKWYLKGSFIAAVIGLVQFVSFQIGFGPGYNFRWILNKWGVVQGGNFGIRINSVFGEPTYLGAVLAGAFFISLYNIFLNKRYHLSLIQSLVIITVYLLSFSGLAQTGVFISLVLLFLNFGLFRYFIIAIPAGLILFNVMYNNVTEFRERYDSTVGLFSGKEGFKLGKTHGSSFILYNNYKVAMKNFESNFLFGTGLGSHPTAFSRYSTAKDFKVYGFNLNSADANYMLLRLISETGLFGVLIFFFIVFKCYVSRDALNESSHWLISNAILVMILLNLFRQGHYFLNGFPFFVLMYIYNYLSYTQQLPGQETENSEVVDMLQKESLGPESIGTIQAKGS